MFPARLPKLFICRAAGVPALGRMLLDARAENELLLKRPPAGTAPTWFCCIDCRRLDVCCWKDAGRMLLCVDPKKRCAPPFRMVPAAGARPLADKLARVGTTGRFPAIMRAPPICCRVAAIAPTRPAPKCPAFIADIAWPICPSRMLATLENRIPLCRGAMPP